MMSTRHVPNVPLSTTAMSAARPAKPVTPVRSGQSARSMQPANRLPHPRSVVEMADLQLLDALNALVAAKEQFTSPGLRQEVGAAIAQVRQAREHLKHCRHEERGQSQQVPRCPGTITPALAPEVPLRSQPPGMPGTLPLAAETAEAAEPASVLGTRVESGLESGSESGSATTPLMPLIPLIPQMPSLARRETRRGK